MAMEAERAGYRLFGFSLETLRLTEAHFHCAGFAAALIAGLVCRASADGLAAQVAALCVPGGTAVVLAGFFIGGWVQLAGAVLLTVAMWLVGWLTPTELGPDPTVRRLLTISSGMLAVTMLLLWIGTRRGDRPAASADRLDGRHPWSGQRVRLRALRHARLASERGAGVTDSAVPQILSTDIVSADIVSRETNMADRLIYAEVGATRHGPLPGGYRQLRFRTRIERALGPCGRPPTRCSNGGCIAVRGRASTPRIPVRRLAAG